ncbi:uncharacterized protein DS421_17g582380 [Arachis hypogaea]|nr:uncharacterized protein DS421_17g582380 [Arachis hypogaea]
MSEPKKAIVVELGFGGLMHIPPMNVPHKLLKELANSFNLGKNKLDTSYGDLFPDKVSFKDLSEDNKDFHTLYSDGVLMDKITEGNWGAHVLDFIVKGISNYRLKKKKSIDGCLYALMIIYFHLTKHANKKAEAILGPPWVSHWNRELLVARIRAEIDGHMDSTTETESKSDDETQSKKRKHIIEDSSSEEEIQSYDGFDLGIELLQEFLRESKKKKTNEKAAAKGKKGARLRSTEGHYDLSETMPYVNLGSESDPLFQGQADESSINKPADSMLSLVEESASGLTQQKMMVVRMETHLQSEPLSTSEIQVCMPLSQITAPSPVPAIEPFPQSLQARKLVKKELKVSYISTRSNPAPEATAATLMMMARTASYVPKELPIIQP